MYEPNIRITSGIQNSLNKIEDIRNILKGIPVLPIIEEHIQRQALVETVHYTARIEGNPLDIQVAEKFASVQLAQPKAENEQELSNLYKAMEFVRYIASKDDTPINEDVIKQIHAFIIRNIPSQGTSGAYKIKENAIVDHKTREHIFLPPKPTDTLRLMAELSAWLTQKPLAFHPVIAAGIAHLELVAIHPFDNGNGRTARALADLILYRYGYSFRYLFSWVRLVGIEMGTYHNKIRQTLGSKYGDNVDPTIWLEYFVNAVARSLEDIKPKLITMRDQFVNIYDAGAKKGLSHDQVEAFVFAAMNGNVTTGEYMRTKGLSRATVVKRLNEMVKLGLLKIEGKGRSVKYVPSSKEISRNEPEKNEGTQLPLKLQNKSDNQFK